jgi:hypothetical protein
MLKEYGNKKKGRCEVDLSDDVLLIQSLLRLLGILLFMLGILWLGLKLRKLSKPQTKRK